MKQIADRRIRPVFDYISELSEMWIETFLFKNMATNEDYISELSEMWIETLCEVALGKMDKHYISELSEMWIETLAADVARVHRITSLNYQRCGLKRQLHCRIAASVLHYISDNSEMWIETGTKSRTASKLSTDYISDNSEMWIETYSGCG